MQHRRRDIQRYRTEPEQEQRQHENASLHKPGKLTIVISQWAGRLMGAVGDRSFHTQGEQYEANMTKRDFLWNGIGTGCWGVVFPILTMIVTQLTGAEDAGMFSLAFVAASLLMILANFGVRTFQVSDLDEEHSFADYQANRLMTCLAMMLVGWLYCVIHGYGATMFTMCMGLFFYKMIDGFADVYEGRLQQMGKLYLGGISMTLRSVVAFIFFTVALLITGSLPIASWLMGISALATMILVTMPLAYLETPKSRTMTLSGVASLFKQAWPMFAALFMYALVDNMPKFVMEGQLSYDNQLYFNALYFPAQYILLTAQLVYKPMLVNLAETWQDPAKRKRFNLIILAVCGIIVVITAVMALVMHFVGLWVMGILYGIDFEQFHTLCLIMLAAGGMTAGIDFIYQTTVILRRQMDCMVGYVISFVLSLFVPLLLIHYAQLAGAVIGYLIVMVVLFMLMIWIYLRILLEKPARVPQRDRNVPPQF